VTFNAVPDYETKSSYSFNVKASDPSGANNVQAVTVNVTNVNDNPVVLADNNAAPTVANVPPSSAQKITLPPAQPSPASVVPAGATAPTGGVSLPPVVVPPPITGAASIDRSLWAIERTIAPSNIAGGLGGSAAGTGGAESVVAALNALPPTSAAQGSNPPSDAPSGAAQIFAKMLPDGGLALTTDRESTDRDSKLLLASGGRPDVLTTPIGFPVVRITDSEVPFSMQAGSASGGGHRLFVFQGITSERLERVDTGVLRIPRDAFADTDPVAVVVLEARLADGRPLPDWLKFDGLNGTLTGEPPPGVDGEIEIEVIARDSDGREARTTFKLSIEGVRASADGQARTAQETELGLAVDKEETARARLEAARQAIAERLGPEKGAGGKLQPRSAAAFSEQLRAVKAARDPLLDRIAKSSESPPRVR
jgi:hypothetical protein